MSKRVLKLKTLAYLLSCKTTTELAKKLNVSRAVLYASKIRPFKLGPALERVGINPRFLGESDVLFLDFKQGIELIRNRLSDGKRLTWFELYFLLLLVQERFASLAVSQFKPNCAFTELLFNVVKKALMEHLVPEYKDFFVKNFDGSDVNYYVCDICSRVLLRILEIKFETEKEVFAKEPFSSLLPVLFYFALGAVNKEYSIPSCFIDFQKLPPLDFEPESKPECINLGDFSIVLFPFKDLFHVELKHSSNSFISHFEFSNFVKILALSEDGLSFSTSKFSFTLKLDISALKKRIRKTNALKYYLSEFGCF